MRCKNCNNQIDKTMKYCPFCSVDLRGKVQRQNDSKQTKIMEDEKNPIAAVGFIVIIIIIIAYGVYPLLKKHNNLSKGNGIGQLKVESYIKEKLLDKYNIPFTIKLKFKENITYCSTPFLDSTCLKSKKIKNAYIYNYEITGSDGIVASVVYYDSYYLKNRYYNMEYNDNYLEKKVKLEQQKEMDLLLTNYVKEFKFEEQYKSYEWEYIGTSNVFNESQYDIFINYNDSIDLKNLIKELDNCIDKYNFNRVETEGKIYTSYNLYIIKNEELYNLIDYSVLTEEDFNQDSHFQYILSKLTHYSVTRISRTNSEFNEELFLNNGNSNDSEDKITSSFKYIVFCYEAEPNSVKNGDDLSLFVYGLK